MYSFINYSTSVFIILNKNYDVAFKRKSEERGLLQLKAPLYIRSCGFYWDTARSRKWERCGTVVKKRITSLPTDLPRLSDSFFASRLIGLITCREAYRTFDAKAS
jgi:hypothetical protein